MSKKLLGRPVSLLVAAAQYSFLQEVIPDVTYLQGLEAVITIELLALGLTEREIELSARFDLHPQDCRIEQLIEDFPPDASKSRWADKRPLSFTAYEHRLGILSLLDAYYDYDDKEFAENATPEDWMNIGARLVLSAYVADLEYVEDIEKAHFGSLGGKGRLGKTFSLAKQAIIFALDNGYHSAADITSYFQTEPTMEDIDIEIYYEAGDPDTFSFLNLSTNKKSRPVKSTTLPSAISQIKALRKSL